ncbi:MAG: nucleotidyltransferase [Bacilli bacterium]|nr:nucleotidyltransferase [Bacilli bacterium]
MEVIGIVCEYNPFHNGHIYQIKKIKEMFKESIIIVILSGLFTQRGEISTLSKKEKTELSLNHGVDLVVELPTIYASQSADIFAYQAIKILNKLKITKLVFGSESNDIEKLKQIALMQEDKLFDEKVSKEMNKGISFPNALKNVLNLDFEYLPNDLLGISYIKAINSINKKIEPISILRTNNYHDLSSNNKIISAENIRNKYLKKMDISKYCPIKKINTIDYELYFNIIKIKILTDSHLNEYVDVDEGIENRLIKFIKESNTLIDFIEHIKTKRYSYNKISRMLLHILLGFKKENNKEYNHIKILGFNNTGQEYLNKLKLKDKEDKFIKNFELNACLIYDLLANTNTYQFELKNIPIQK